LNYDEDRQVKNTASLVGECGTVKGQGSDHEWRLYAILVLKNQ
jgi:hypothetical protein